MSGAGRFIGRCAMALGAVVVLAGAGLWSFGDRIYPRVLEAAGRAAGFTLTAHGPVRLQLWPGIAITAADLDVAPDAPAWDARLQRLRVEIALRPLLHGRLDLEGIEIRGAQMRVQRTAAGDMGEFAGGSALARARIQVSDVRVHLEGATASDRRTIHMDRWLSGPGPNGHPRLEARGSVDGSAFTVDAQYEDRAKRVGGVMTFPLMAAVSVPDWKLDGTLQGHVRDPLHGRGVALDATLASDDVSPLFRLLGLPPSLAGRLSLHASLDGDLPRPRLADVRATLDGGDALGASVEGAGISLSTRDIESLHLAYRGPLPVGAPRGIPKVHRVDVHASLKGAPGRYTLELHDLRVAMAARMRVDARGNLELPTLTDWGGARGRLDIKADAPDLAAVLGRDSKPPLGDLGAVAIRGRLIGPLASATLEDMTFRLGSNGHVHITAKGKAGPLDLTDPSALLAAADADVSMDAAIPDGKVLQHVMGGVLATVNSWSARGRLQTSRAGWRLSDLDVSGGSTGAIAIRLSGEASGRGALTRGVGRLAAGTVGQGDTARFDVAVETASERGTALLTGINIPELGAMKVKGRLHTKGGGIALQGLALESAGPLAVKLTGDVGRLAGWRDVNVEMVLAPTPPEVIDRLLDLELPLTGAVSLGATLSRPGQQVLHVSADARVGSSQFDVELTTERTATVPLVKGSIRSASIRADDFWLSSSTPASPVARTAKPAEPQPSLGLLGILPGLAFVLQDAVEQEQYRAETARGTNDAAEALPWSRLKHVDIDIDIHADAVHGPYVSGGPLDLRLQDRGGRLEFGPATLVFKDGSTTLHGVADSNVDPPSLSVEGRGKNLPVEELAAQAGFHAAHVAGRLSFDYMLKSRGHSLPDLRADLQGGIRAMVEHGRFPLGELDLLSGNLLDWLLSWAGSGKDTPVPCAVAHFSIVNGIARANALYLKTDHGATYGVGTLDLRSDSVDLTIAPKVAGIHLSKPATVRIHGPLASPQLSVANEGAVLARYGAEALAAFEFPPLLLAGPLLTGLTASVEKSPCH